MSAKKEEATMLEELKGKRVGVQFFYGYGKDADVQDSQGRIGTVEGVQDWVGLVDKVDENLVRLKDADRENPRLPGPPGGGRNTLIVNTKSPAFVRFAFVK